MILDIDGIEYEYTGELDENGLACGEGIALQKFNNKYAYKGSFADDFWHGVCKYLVV